MNRYTIHKGTTLLLEPRYCGSIAWYAAMAAHDNCIVDYNARHDKRHKLTHRATIADVNGELSLTVPLSHPSRALINGPLCWSHMRLSAHGEWWNVHRVAMESAYGRTPFFEYYIDRFMPAWSPGVVETMGTIEALDRHIDSEIRKLLDLNDDVDTPTGEVIDMRGEEPLIGTIKPYYQIRASKLGFIPGLSVLDLLFNMGPEAQIYLKKLVWNQ